MAKWTNDTGLDQALNWFADVNQVTVCSDEPATYDQANKTLGTDDGMVLARGTITGGQIVGPADGDTDGRKITYPAQTDIPVEATGTATHLAWTKTGDMTLRAVTTGADKVVNNGATMNTTSVEHTVRDAV